MPEGVEPLVEPEVLVVPEPLVVPDVLVVPEPPVDPDVLVVPEPLVVPDEVVALVGANWTPSAASRIAAGSRRRQQPFLS